MSETGSLLIAEGDKIHFAMDTLAQTDVWMLRSGPDSWIECYGEDGAIRTVLMRDARHSSNEWRSFLAAMPEDPL